MADAKNTGASVNNAVGDRPQEGKKLKACCACPETKKVRDQW